MEPEKTFSAVMRLFVEVTPKNIGGGNFVPVSFILHTVMHLRNIVRVHSTADTGCLAQYLQKLFETPDEKEYAKIFATALKVDPACIDIKDRVVASKHVMNQPRHLIAESVKELTNPDAAYKFNYVCRNFLLRVKMSLKSPMSETAFPTGVTAEEAADIGKHVSELVMNSGVQVPASCAILVAAEDPEEEDVVLDISTLSVAPTVNGLQFIWAKSTDPDPASTALLKALRKPLLAGPAKPNGAARRVPAAASARSAAALPPVAPKKKKRGKGGGAKESGDPLRGATTKSVRGVNTPVVQQMLADMQAAAAEAILDVNAEADTMEPYYTVRAVPPHEVWMAGGVAVVVQFPFSLNDSGPPPGWVISTKKIITNTGAGGTYATTFQLSPGGQGVDSLAPNAFPALPVAGSWPLVATRAPSQVAPVVRLLPDSGSRRPRCADAPPAPAAATVPAASPGAPPAGTEDYPPMPTAGATAPSSTGGIAPVVPAASPPTAVGAPPMAPDNATMEEDPPPDLTGSTAASPGAAAATVADIASTPTQPLASSPEVSLVFPPPPLNKAYAIGADIHSAIMSVMGLTNDDLKLGPNDTLMMTTVKTSPPPPTTVEVIFSCDKELDLTPAGERKGQHQDFLIALYPAHPIVVEQPKKVVRG
ncbi:hypothetical protein BU14_0216s0001 [Porphyra umbilicalis]|uniref:Uncharacterized protein n=1 Tax=Porphyra umbilicalis TaxID=2786 RepID=A0A1X6P585_PORUM|nr:hypothetical protein BU14_0216s0001 [Porphyra umbilicalis]|eukprot:OSX75910.1 hypothetical protein BU14_0216s0001 [Porphyra umbilicalis]